jgi:hypothetical protein
VNNNNIDVGDIKSGGVYWIGLALDKDQWRVLLNTTMKLRVA